MFDGNAFGREVVDATKAFLERAIAPLKARLDAFEESISRIAEALKAAPTVELIDERVAAEIAKALAAQPKLEFVDVDAAVEVGTKGLVASIARLSEENVALRSLLDQGNLALKEARSEAAAAAVRVQDQISAVEARLPDIAERAAKAALEAMPKPKDGANGSSVTLDELVPVIEGEVAKRVADLPPPKDGASVTVDDVRPLIADAVTKAVADLPPPKDGANGTSVTIEQIAPLVDEAVMRAVSALPPPDPGKYADPAEVERLVGKQVAQAVALLPPPKDGENADPAVVADLVRTEVDKRVSELPPAKNGTSVTVEDVSPMIDELVAKRLQELPQAPTADEIDEKIAASVEAKVASIPHPKNGTSVTIDDVRPVIAAAVAALPKPENGKSVTIDELLPVINDLVAKAVAALPVPKDGVGLAGALIDRAGHLVVTLTDGTTRDLGPVVGKDGEPGKNGADGFGFDNLEQIDEDLAFGLRFALGDKVKEFRFAKANLADLYKGAWREGQHTRGSVVTWGGALWLAKCDTEARPETNDDWKLIVKKGRDGKDGEAPKPPPTVKLK